MVLIHLPLRSLLRNKRRTFLLIFLIAFGTAFVFFANAIFLETASGLEASFVRSFTGDFAVGAAAGEAYGLFGNELPIVEEYENVPPLPAFSLASALLNESDGIAAFAPLISGAGLIRIGRASMKAPIFGIDGESYRSVCPEARLPDGSEQSLRSGGVILSAALARSMETTLKRPLVMGEAITLTSAVAGSFRVRRGSYAGTVSYPAPNEILDRVVLVDPKIARGLSSYTAGSLAPAAAEKADADSGAELDDLFAEAEDIASGDGEAGIGIDEVRKTLREAEALGEEEIVDSGAWSFVLVRVVDGADRGRALRETARRLAELSPEFRVLDWKTAAGSSVTALFALKTAFNIGVAFLVLGASLVVMNALVLSVLERTGEIGTMRALGASRSFVRALFVFETLMLTVSGALLGILLGSAAVAAAASAGIRLENPMLAALFAGAVLRPRADPASAAAHLLGAVLVASFAWIYPVALALKVSPLEAMREGE